MKSKGFVAIAVSLGAIALLAANLARADNAAAPAPAKPQSKRKLDFNRDIRPILSDNCFFCHGPDINHREGKVRFDTKEGLFSAHEDATPVVPGKPDDSTMYQRITSDDPDDRMPAKKSNKRLKPEQIALIKQWIEEGADWKPHWSYVPPVRAEIPADSSIDGFTRSPIDNFVAATLAEQNLKPSPEADRRTLVRRLSLDLIGLPPTPEEVDAFVADKEPNAYEKLVNRLLASPHYGERMSVFWMDLVRYGDSIGFHSDNPREVWPWRDWCINAFNANEPFDQMTIDQLAGDLVPNPTREQKVASAYNRLLLTTGEGGAQAKEYIAKYAGDRVRNVSTTWMGATMGCCQCHDHKFDPYSQKDFYQMAAFFADIQEPPISLPQPELLLPNQQQQEELERLTTAIDVASKKLNTPTTQIAAAQTAWEAKAREAIKDPTPWTPLNIVEAKSEGGAIMNVDEKRDAIRVSGNAPDVDTYTIKATSKLKKITALRLEALPHKTLPAGGPGRAFNGNFVLTEFDAGTLPPAPPAPADPKAAPASPPPTTQPIAFQAASASYEQTSGAEASPYRRWPAAAAIDGDKFGNKIGWAILDRANQPNYAVFETAYDITPPPPAAPPPTPAAPAPAPAAGAPAPAAPPAPAASNKDPEVTLVVKLQFKLGEKHSLGNFRLDATDYQRPVRAIPDSGIPAPIVAILKLDPAKLTPEQKEKLAAHYRSISPELEPVRKELADLNQDKLDLTGPPSTNKYTKKFGAIPRTLMSVSGPPRETRILARGNWLDDSGEVVTPHVPHFLRQLDVPADKRASRLDLAHWLVARDNPLTARVFVNRLWKLFYGQGLVKPLDDMGAQSEWPTHPELLDTLAVEFMDSGWDVKHLVKLLVSSGTYRQSSAQPKDLREKDPYNKYLARQTAFRLDAEFVRDNALAISGLLSPRMFGPSVKPYQPPGYWDFLNFPKRTYESDHGESLYRRGVYTWWQRTFLNPSLLNFDAPSHEECTAERTRSNTPQQALTLLNDVTYVEAARVFAAKIITCGSKDPQQRLKWAYEHALLRDPTPQETPVILALLDKHLKRYAADKPAAEKLVAEGEAPAAKDADVCELAAWTSVARTILNLHETITRN